MNGSSALAFFMAPRCGKWVISKENGAYKMVLAKGKEELIKIN